RCRVLHLQLWGAAVPLNVCKQGFLLDAEANIGACGDWLAAPSVEGAIASGLAMGEAIAGEALVSSQVPLFQAFQAPAIGSFAEDKPAAKAESSREKKGVWNFAFGANLSPWKLRTKRGIAPLEQVPGKLPGWRLVFNHKGGMGNIEPLERCTAQGEDPGAVHGLLLLLKPPDFEKLSKMEHEYVTTEVEVEAYDGRVIRARAFVSPKDYRLATYPNPPERYIKLIRDGASSSSLHGEYQAWLRTIPGAQQRGAEYWDHAARRRTGRYQMALERFEKILRGHGVGFSAFNLWMLYVDYGFTLVALNRFEEAIQPLEHGLSRNAAVPHGQNALGYALASLNQLQEAQDVFARGLEYDPENPVLWSNLAVVWMAAGAWQQAAQGLEKALLIEPDNQVVIHNAVLLKGVAQTGQLSAQPKLDLFFSKN
ncbi:unnamed protein product, partial [Effrenium voratum]